MIKLDGRDRTVRNIHDEVGKPPIGAFVLRIMLAIHKIIFISTSMELEYLLIILFKQILPLLNN